MGGPLVAGYCIAENFKAFGEPDKARKTWIYTILATVVIFGIAFAIPGNSRSGEYLIPLLYAWAAYYLVEHYQGANITAHINAGGGFYNWRRAIIVTIIGVAITFGALVGIVYATDFANSNEVINKYGAAQSEVHFDKTNMTSAEADQIGRAFMDVGLFASGGKVYTYAEKTGSDYEISISCNNTVTTDPNVALDFTQIRSAVQRKFPKNKIIFKLILDRLDNVVKRIE